MLPLQHRTVGKAGVEPAVSCSQGTRGTVPLPPGHSFLCSSDPCGIRTQPLQLERLTTSPEVERAILLSVRAPRAQWVGRRSNPRLRLFRPPLNRLSYRPMIRCCSPATTSKSGNKKSPMSLRHRAFISRQTVFRPSVTSAKDAAGYFVGTDYLCPRNNPPLCILGSNLVVKTSWKEQPEKACHLGADRDRRSLTPSKHLRRRKGSGGSH